MITAMSRQAEKQLDFGLEADENAIVSKPSHEALQMHEADVTMFRAFFSHAESDRFFLSLMNQTRWRQDKIRLYGKQIDLPRLTAWYGDPGKSGPFVARLMMPAGYKVAPLCHTQAEQLTIVSGAFYLGEGDVMK